MGTPVTNTPSKRSRHEWYLKMGQTKTQCRHCGIVATKLAAMDIADRFIPCIHPNDYHAQEVEDVIFEQQR